MALLVIGLSAGEAMASDGAETSLINPAPDLIKDSDVVLRLDDGTGTTSIHSLTFDSSKNPVTLTVFNGNTLTISSVSPTTGVSIFKTGEFDSVIFGGSLVTGLSSYSIGVDSGLLTIASALTGANKTLIINGPGTLELTSRDPAHNIANGIFVNSGTLRISDDLNLGAKSDNPNFVDLRGGSLEIFNSAVTLGNARALIIDRGDGSVVTTGATSALNILGNGQLQGTLGALDKSGQGALVIGGSNAYSGNVTVSQGTLELRQPGSLGADTKSPVLLSSTAVLNLHSDATTLNFNNGITLGGNAAIDFARILGDTGGNFLLGALTTPAGVPTPGTLTVVNSSRDGSILHFLGPVNLNSDLTLNVAGATAAQLDNSIQGGATGLTKTGQGTLIITGSADNRFSKAITANQGILALAKTGGAAAVPSDLVINGALVRLDGDNQIADSSNINLFQGTLNINTRSDSATSLTMTGGTLVTGVGGRLFLTLPVGAAVPSSFPGGPVAAPAVPALNISGGVTTINSGGEINATTVQVSGGVNTVSAGGLFTMGSGGLTFAGNLSPNITFVSDGANPGRLSLSGNVTYTGAAGMATLSSTGGLALAGTIDLNGAQRDFSVGDDGTSAVDMLISATITNGSLKKSGAGTLRLTAANTYAGGTTISAGILELGGAGTLGSGALTFNSGQLNLRSDSPVSIVNTPLISTASDVILNVDRDTIAGGITGNVFMSGGLTIAANQLMISGANRSVLFTGSTTLMGTAKINAATSAVDVTFTSPVLQSGGVWGLTKDGPGKLTFQGAAPNQYTGTTRVQGGGTLVLNMNPGVTAIPGGLDVFAGTARLMTSNQIADASAVTVNIGGTLDLNGNSETFASLNGTGGNVTLGGGTLTVTQGTYPGVISGGGMVVQENLAGGTSSILTLSGLQTFTGGAIVNHGSVNFSLQAPGHTGTTLNSGIWRAFNGSSLNFNAGSNITTNNAEVVLSGAASNFAKINSLASNGGTFTISGGKTFTAVGALSNSGTLTVGAGSTLTLNNNFTNTGNATITGSLVAAGIINTSGNLTLNGPQQYAVATSMNVTAGTTAINSDAGSPGVYRLSINGSGGALQLGATQHLSNLTLTGAATLGTAPGTVSAGPLALVTQALSTSGNGTLDLTNNALIVDYTGATTAPFNAVKAAIILAYNPAGTHWAGHGITSATAAANSTAYGIGYAEASAALGISGIQTAPFHGQTVDSTSVLACFTKLGDATLDGAVDFNDLVKLAQNYNTAGATWNTGDFTYDGTTDFNDLVKLAQNYNTALPDQPIPGAPADFNQDLARAFAQVPEPSSFAVISVLGLGMILAGRHRGVGCRASEQNYV